MKNINCEIEGGRTTEIIGKSGCGKTTLVQLIPRFYTPQRGVITIDGVDIKAQQLHGLRRQIGFVQQEPLLFVGTIFENTVLDQLDVEQWRVEEVAELANVHEFVQKLPLGYKIQVGERGTQLSQGQKQRFVLARALFRDTSILILDEGTSALDMESEKRILRALRKVRQERTTVVISHRLSAIKDADCILVLENGAVVEQGTHETLIANGQAYSQMYQQGDSNKESVS